jgi:hypothetical protein
MHFRTSEVSRSARLPRFSVAVILRGMKTTTLNAGQGSSPSRRNPKKTAGLSHYTVNGTSPSPANSGISEKFITCAQAAKILRFADQILTAQDRAQIAAGTEEARRRMNNEHLR